MPAKKLDQGNENIEVKQDRSKLDVVRRTHLGRTEKDIGYTDKILVNENSPQPQFDGRGRI